DYKVTGVQTCAPDLVVELLGDIAEVTVSFLGCEDSEELGGCGMIETLSLVIEEEEQLVFHNWAADRATKHVPAQRCSLHLWDGEVVFPTVRVQLVVAEEFPQVAMELVGTRLNARADDAPLEVAELGGGVLGD